MRCSSRHNLSLCAALAAFVSVSTQVHAQPVTDVSPTEQVLQQSASAGKFTFIVFYRDADPATQALTASLQQGLAAYSNQAVVTHAQVTQPVERALVERFGVARAPLPMAVAVGPNGATTGVFRKDAAPATFANAFVPPTMLQCMKHLQEGKLVFVNVHATPEPQVPQGVVIFASSPDFISRTAFVSMSAGDTREAMLMGQMKLEPASITGTKTVLIAPPGVLVGHFDATSTPDQIGQAVHKAGKCCDDPNCKHNR